MEQNVGYWNIEECDRHNLRMVLRRISAAGGRRISVVPGDYRRSQPYTIIYWLDRDITDLTDRRTLVMVRWSNPVGQLAQSYGIFGTLQVGDMELYTVELPWRNNAANISCIPPGDYPLVRCRHYKGKYDTYEIGDVPDRSHIKFDVANTVDDLRGCVGVGTGLGWVDNKWGVRCSRAGHQVLCTAIEDLGLQRIRIEGGS